MDDAQKAAELMKALDRLIPPCNIQRGRERLRIFKYSHFDRKHGEVVYTLCANRRECFTNENRRRVARVAKWLLGDAYKRTLMWNNRVIALKVAPGTSKQMSEEFSNLVGWMRTSRLERTR